MKNNILKYIVDILDNKKAKNIKIFEVSSLTPFFDYILIASGLNIVHTKSLVLALQEALKKNNQKIKNIEKDLNYNWIILDCNGLIINIFEDTTREFYKLESLWADAKEILLKQ